MPLIPTNLSHAAEFVQFLQDAGLIVSEVEGSHLEGMFKDEMGAAFVRTDRGVVEVVIFPGATDAEKIKVTTHRTGSPIVPYKYTFEGLPTNGQAHIWHSAYPTYFTMCRNWFIVVRDQELDRAIKEAVKSRS